MIKLYDLVGRDGLHFSPFGWRARMALAHKGVTAQIVPVRFGEIADIPHTGEPWKSVPILEHDGKMIFDSWHIATYLEENFSDGESLFGGERGVAFNGFFKNWVELSVHRLFAPALMREVLDCIDNRDTEYFRTSREKRFGKTLEELASNADAGIQAARDALMPASKALERAKFFGGETPVFSDYILFASLQWARLVSNKDVIGADEPLQAWMDRCLNLFSSMAKSHLSRRERDNR
ncbi:MAG: glutathione S-transferase N-terminal domain-containing protein [Hyphomicrobiales bacterium]|nr:glutathione S-transferase N-terminal domain-containing protein [Hyphomicrobiales bacterium]MCY4048328.1 glutathione S-transferase N-terminal domain-containing protein [Hyphomicrobiales bacterium]